MINVYPPDQSLFFIAYTITVFPSKLQISGFKAKKASDFPDSAYFCGFARAVKGDIDAAVEATTIINPLKEREWIRTFFLLLPKHIWRPANQAVRSSEKQEAQSI